MDDDEPYDEEAVFAAHWKADTGFFGPGSMMWKVMRSRLIGLAGSRALVMQLSMPDIAQGVFSYSIFMRSPLQRAQQTFASLSKIIFGSEDEARKELAKVRGKHGAVQGELSADASRLRAGDSYSARNPEAKLWVLASFASTVQVMHDRLFVALTGAELDALWEDWRRFGLLFGVPETTLPSTWAEFESYVGAMVAGNAARGIALEPDTKLARILSRRLFRNWLALLLSSGVTTWGLLPERLRHLCVVTPPVFVAIRHRAVMTVLRWLARLGPDRQRFEPSYLRALERLGPHQDRLEPWERRLATDLKRSG